MSAPTSTRDSAGGTDLVTERAAVLLTDRPVVAFSPAVVQAQRECEAAHRKLQFVTSHTSRLTSPLCQLVAAGRADWVVRADAGYYAGLTGRPLQWDGRAFVPVPDARDYAPTFKVPPADPLGAHLTLVLRARHPANAPVGGTVSDLMNTLTAAPPAGWGAFEPTAHAWRPEHLDQAVRDGPFTEAPVVVTGGGTRPAIAVMEFSRTEDGGFAEQTTVDFGYSPGEPLPLTDLPSLVADLGARHPVASLLAQLRPGRADLTVEPRWTGTPSPLGLAVNGTHPGPEGIPAAHIGSVTWFDLGDGRTPDAWRHYQRLLQHLQNPR